MVGRTKIDVIQWSALSSDLNPIENVWGALARRVYANGRQFQSCHALIEVLQKVWDEIEPELLVKLVSTMQNRCVSVLEKKGGSIYY